MKVWAYRQEFLPTGDDLNAFLNGLGAQGWEHYFRSEFAWYTVDDTSRYGSWYYFKREGRPLDPSNPELE